MQAKVIGMNGNLHFRQKKKPSLALMLLKII